MVMDHSTKETALIIGSWTQIPDNFSGVINYYGDYHWLLNGRQHRDDGPAIEWANGTKFWFLNGKQHRENGHAVEYSNGEKCWFLNGQRHRDDGPAAISFNGTKEWWLNNEQLTQEEWFSRLTPEKKEKALFNMDQW